MGIVEFNKFNLNKFWELTPNPLKYILIISILIATIYFIFSKRDYRSYDNEMKQISRNIEVTYTLINNFEEFKNAQTAYNKEVITYLYNLHGLVNELADNTNKKFNIILSSDNNNKQIIVDKINILSESFDKISKIYTSNLPKPQESKKTTIDSIELKTFK